MSKVDVPEQVKKDEEFVRKARKEMEKAEKAKEKGEPIKVEKPEEPKEQKPEEQEVKPEEIKEPELKPESKDKEVAIAPEKENDPEYLKSRLSTSEGYARKLKEDFEKERDEMKRQIAETNERLQQQAGKIELLTSQKPEKEPEPLDVRDYFSEDEIELQGEDELRFQLERQKRLIREESERVEKKLREEFESRVSPVETMTANRSFWDQVNALSPGAEELDKTMPEDFMQWLEQEDALTGYTKRQIAERALTEQDASALARVFNSYRKEVNKTETVKKEPVVEPHQAANAPKTDVNTKPVYSESQINDFYKTCNEDPIFAESDEGKKIRKQIKAAVDEGRVRK